MEQEPFLTDEERAMQESLDAHHQKLMEQTAHEDTEQAEFNRDKEAWEKWKQDQDASAGDRESEAKLDALERREHQERLEQAIEARRKWLDWQDKYNKRHLN